MLIAMNEMACPGKKKSELFRWKRFTKKENSKPGLDYDSVDHWIKRVEQASEFAVSEVFSIKKTDGHRRPVGLLMDLETTGQLKEHDDAYVEAQDLLQDWMNSKLRLELTSDEENVLGKLMEEETSIEEAPAGFLKYNRFDDLYDYLEQEVENSTVQDFMQQLLQKEVMHSGILEDFQGGGDRQKKRKDPRLSMDLRHQQVKENRIKRQKELEHQRRDQALKKSALSEAQLLVQEENKRKAMKTRKEEEDIQREMVKLRKEMSERRRVMEDTWKSERKRLELRNAQKPSTTDKIQVTQSKPLAEIRGMQKKAQVQEQLAQIHNENIKCLQKHFSAWYKMILERRVKSGKARALADWKCQLRAFQAWRDHVWAKKMKRETQKLELDLREQNRKQQLSVQYDRKRVLRHSFAKWQSWCRTEKEMRELQAKKEETKKKMSALLETAASLVSPCDPHKDQNTKSGHVQNISAEQNLEEQSAAEERSEEVTSASDSKWSDVNKSSDVLPAKPKYAWQITLKHAALTPEKLAQCRSQGLNVPQWLLNTQLHSVQRRAPLNRNHFDNCHTFQQHLIEDQRRQLLEQREMILELKENQRLMMLQKEAECATAITKELNNQVSRSKAPLKKGSQLEQEDPSSLSSTVPSIGLDSNQADTSKRTLRHRTSPHPMLKAMEERAAQRAERKKELEELKRKREEEKLAQLKAEKEEHWRQEAAEKAAQIERKRDEKRLQQQKEMEKQKRLEWQQQLHRKAQDHYQNFLLRSQGLEPWKRLVVQARQQMVGAEKHHCSVLQRRCLLAWLQQVQESLRERRKCADDFYSQLLLQRSFQNWLKYKDCLLVLEERADWFFKASLKKTTFLAWLNMVNEERIALWEKQHIAADHHHRRVVLAVFKAWRRFPKLMKEEKEREQRREQLRKKVAEILPDFRI